MMKVYIVDDSQLFIDELRLTVPWEQFGCEVAGTANDAETAQIQIRSIHPDIVISDICMGSKTGLDLIDSLADLENIEYILISAYSRFEYALRAIRLNVADYFVKPIDDDEFYAALERLVQKVKCRQQGQSKSADTASSVGVKIEKGGYLDRAIQYMEEHYMEEISASTVANAVYISESCLSKQFRKKLDTSFNEYLNYVRIKKAEDLLLTTELKIYEIAQRTGFNNEKYFSIVFRKVTGITPRQFKNNTKGE